jgi:hypothetical protein
MRQSGTIILIISGYGDFGKKICIDTYNSYRSKDQGSPFRIILKPPKF